MGMLAKLKENAVTIAVIVAALAIASAVYERYFSDKAELIRVLEKQIKEQDQYVADLKKQFQELNEEEQKRLQEIEALKVKLTEVQQMIQQGEVNLDELKDRIIDLDDALGTIEEHTRGAVARGRGVLAPPDSGTGR
jgi:septal ring factor EnvC (AmiA/AmiB activator)